MISLYINYIAKLLGIKDWQVENCIQMFEDGDTIPFISRYRKEKTGGLDDADVAEVKHWADVFADMDKRKKTMLETIAAQGKLSDELRAKIENSTNASELEDLYLPYRPKRRTRATVAKEAGLEPLADLMYQVRTTDPLREASKFLMKRSGMNRQLLQGLVI